MNFLHTLFLKPLTLFLPSIALLPSTPTPSLLPIPLSPPPAPSPPSTTSSHSASGSDTVIPGQTVPIGVISEEDKSEWNKAHVPAEEEELEDHEIQLLYPYTSVDPATLYDSPPETPLDRLDQFNVSQSPESVLSPRPILPYTPLAFRLVCSPSH